MGRAEMRRLAKQEKKSKTKTYNFTKEQLDLAIREGVKKEFEKIKDEATNEAVTTALILTLTLPLEVLMDNYWKKSYAKRLPKFTEQILEYYSRWENRELDIEDLKKDLWEYGGVRFEEDKNV